MFGPIHRAILGALLVAWMVAPGNVAAQMETMGSEHLILRMPAERSSVGRDLVSELERSYVFMQRAIGQSLPRKILIVASWDQPDNSCDQRNSIITIGMRQPAAAADPKRYLLHNTAKEIARLGLLELSGGAQREDTEFLFEAMTEILVREYDHTSRSLEAAWAISKYLDEMKLLGVATQRSWTGFASGKRCMRNAAPGITLLTTFREIQGRDAPLKLFEALKKNSLAASLAVAFKDPAAEVENIWLKRVREYQPIDEITVTAEDAPQLLQTALVPGSAKPGTTLEMQLFLKSRNNNLLPEGIFVQDEHAGRVLQPQAPSDKGVGYVVVRLPIEGDRPPGDYKYRVTAIDESGNLRSWTGNYKVVSP
jgi:hypothetical protein